VNNFSSVFLDESNNFQNQKLPKSPIHPSLDSISPQNKQISFKPREILADKSYLEFVDGSELQSSKAELKQHPITSPISPNTKAYETV
jgi:hypothetical protein